MRLSKSVDKASAWICCHLSHPALKMEAVCSSETYQPPLHSAISRISFSCLTVPPYRQYNVCSLSHSVTTLTIYSRAASVCVPFYAHSHPLLGLYIGHAVLYVRYEPTLNINRGNFKYSVQAISHQPVTAGVWWWWWWWCCVMSL
jgi:hypothetical protein